MILNYRMQVIFFKKCEEKEKSLNDRGIYFGRAKSAISNRYL